MIIAFKMEVVVTLGTPNEGIDSRWHIITLYIISIYKTIFV